MDFSRLASETATSLAGLAHGKNIATTERAVMSLLRDPGQNPQLAMLVFAAAVLLVLVFFVVVALLALPSKRPVVRTYVIEGDEDDLEYESIDELRREAGVEDRALKPPKPPSKLFLALTGPAAVSILIVLALAGFYIGTSTDAYCARTCHAQQASVADATKTRHASCTSCHEQRGVFGVLGNSVSRIRMAVRAAGGVAPGNSTAVDSSACLSCHRQVTRETVRLAVGLKVSHREIVAGAIPCTRCHERTGHTARAFTKSMSACIVCHDGKIASAGCTECHSNDPVSATFASTGSTGTVGSGRVTYAAVRAANRDCAACHDMVKQCDPCHGLRMPHSPGFIESGHARAAAFSGKLTCFKCHVLQDCGGCHSAPFDPKTGLGGHPGDWSVEHRAASWDAGCACHSARSDRTEPMCVLCHDAKTHAVLPITQ